MKPENRALLILVLAVVVVAAVGGAYFCVTPQGLPTMLPIPEGTTFSLNDTWSWVAYFNVTATGARLVGAWTAYLGAGDPGLIVVNGSVAAPGGPFFLHGCPRLRLWSTYNGTIDQPVDFGPHTLFWSGGCSGASRIVVTETIRLTPFLFV